jgi:tyramine---L-glutamate ligase
MMKVLIFEYVTGGGFLNQTVPESLALEGQMMVDALISNFAKLPNVETVLFQAKENVFAEFQNALENVQAAWIIAPEFDGILEKLCLQVEQANKILLTSPAKAVAKTANKLTTFEILTAAQIPTVKTEIFNSEKNYDKTREWVIKPFDGAGAENTFLLQTEKDWSALPYFEKPFLIQPHIHGEKRSLSCLFQNGTARVLCVNLQQFEIENQIFKLKNIDVNFTQDDGRYQKLASEIARVFPDLFGYVGIDLIENETGCFVLEINPRLTTSFVQIEEKLGVNVADWVLKAAQDKMP